MQNLSNKNKLVKEDFPNLIEDLLPGTGDSHQRV
jgi:hypothetical protein